MQSESIVWNSTTGRERRKKITFDSRNKKHFRLVNFEWEKLKWGHSYKCIHPLPIVAQYVLTHMYAVSECSFMCHHHSNTNVLVLLLFVFLFDWLNTRCYHVVVFFLHSLSLSHFSFVSLFYCDAILYIFHLLLFAFNWHTISIS